MGVYGDLVWLFSVCLVLVNELVFNDFPRNLEKYIDLFSSTIESTNWIFSTSFVYEDYWILPHIFTKTLYIIIQFNICLLSLTAFVTFVKVHKPVRNETFCHSNHTILVLLFTIIDYSINKPDGLWRLHFK